MLVLDNFLSKKDYDWCLKNKLSIIPGKEGFNVQWRNKDQSPRSLCEELLVKIISILEENYEIDFSNFAGCEYWSTVKHKGEKLEWHVNCDETQMSPPVPTLIVPDISIIFYIEYFGEGGHLFLSNKREEDISDNEDLDKITDESEKIKPILCLIGVFDSGVSPTPNSVPSALYV